MHKAPPQPTQQQGARAEARGGAEIGKAAGKQQQQQRIGRRNKAYFPGVVLGGREFKADRIFFGYLEEALFKNLWIFWELLYHRGREVAVC